MPPENNAIEVVGMRELRRNLNRAGGKEVRKAINAAIKEGANQDVAPRAKKFAPKKTGRLARAVRARVNAKGVFIAANRPYAAPIHWGWPARNIKARPFIQGAIREHGPRFAETYERLMRDWARKVTAELNTRNRRSRR